jgi:hypothetical protein
MRKTELKNCPQWLMNASTKNEDVDFNEYGVFVWRGGEFLGGEFLGGYFRGGEFRGGEFLGGEFRGGEFLGGEFRGGEFRGGEFLGGEFRGGYFRGGYFRGGYFLGGEFRGGYFLGGYFLGGEFRGGYFLGGEFRGGEFRGEQISKAPIFIFNIGKWSASVTRTKMAIGCQVHSHEKWVKFTDDEIRKMSCGEIEFWAKNKELLLLICANEAKAE